MCLCVKERERGGGREGEGAERAREGERGRQRESKAMCVCVRLYDDVQVHSRAAEVSFQSKVLLLPGLTPTCSSVGNCVLSSAHDEYNVVVQQHEFPFKLIGQKCKFYNKTDSQLQMKIKTS